MLQAELEWTRKLQETTASREQPNSELERLQRRQQEAGSGKERKATTPIEPLKTRSRPESKMEVDEVPRRAVVLFSVGSSGTDERTSRDVDPSGAYPILGRSRVDPDEIADCGCGLTWLDAQFDWW